jgi:potassium efflux system protein
MADRSFVWRAATCRGLWLANLVALAVAPTHALRAAAQEGAAAEETAAPDGGIPAGEMVAAPGGNPGDPPAAEGTAAEASSPTDPNAAPAALRGAHLGELASRTRVSLQRARPLLRTDGDVVEIERRLPRSEGDIARRATPLRLSQLSQLSQRELAELRQEWRRFATTFAGWQETLNARAAELESVRSELVELRRSWAQLREASQRAGGNEVRHARILASLEAVRAADAELDPQIDRVLDLQERVSDVAIATEDVMDQLRAASAAYRERLLVRDRPPIWLGLGRPSDEAIAAQEGASWGARVEASRAVLVEQVRPLLGQLAVLAALTALMLAIGRRSLAWPAEDATLDLARKVVRRPFSTALLITLLATPIAVPHAPIVFYDAVSLVSLLPLGRVLFAISPRQVQPLLAALLTMILVNRLEGILPEGSTARRVILLIESSLALVALAAWAYRVSADTDRRVRVLRSISILYAGIIAIALLANVLGYAFLATMLMRGTGFSVYSGLVIVAAIAIAQSMLDLAIRSETGRRLRSFRDHGALIHGRALRLFTFLAAAGWLASTLAAYGLAQPISKWFEETLEHRWEIGSLTISIGAIAVALAILIFTVVLARLIRFVLETDVLPRMKLEPGVDGAISGLTRYILVAIGLLLALASMGIDSSQIAIVAGALGVGVGFGLQGIVANVIAGIVLMLERPVRLGDFIEVGQLVGRVDRIGLRSSTVRALDGAEVIVPNESLIGREVVNWTLSDRKRRVTVNIGVAYGTDPERVLRILSEATESHADVLGGVPPVVAFEGFGASSLDFVVQFWTADFADAQRLKSEVGILVNRALTAAKIEIPFPQSDVHVRSLPPIRSGSSSQGDPAHPRAVE